jgi:hypothetical protein
MLQHYRNLIKSTLNKPAIQPFQFLKKVQFGEVRNTESKTLHFVVHRGKHELRGRGAPQKTRLFTSQFQIRSS